MAKRLMSVIAAAAMVAGVASSAAAAEGDSADSLGSGSVTINGKTYGPEDGVVVLEYSSSASAGLRLDVPETNVPTGPLFRVFWGSSWASSQESNVLYYYAKAQAKGNIYQNQRVFQVRSWESLCNNNGGRYNSSVATSTAWSNGSSWFAGPQVQIKAQDNPSAPSWCKTQWKRSVTLINRNIV